MPEFKADFTGPQKICPFKKHKGKLWEEVAQEDPGYIHWLLEGDNDIEFDNQTRAYLEKLIEDFEFEYDEDYLTWRDS